MRSKCQKRQQDRELLGEITVGEVMAGAVQDPDIAKLIGKIKAHFPVAGDDRVLNQRFQWLIVDNMKLWKNWTAAVPAKHRRAAMMVFIDHFVELMDDYRLALQCLNPERRIL